MVARPEENGTRRVGFHADRAQEAVLERLLLLLDTDERAGGRVRRGLERLEASGRGRLGRLAFDPGYFFGLRIERPATSARWLDQARR